MNWITQSIIFSKSKFNKDSLYSYINTRGLRPIKEITENELYYNVIFYTPELKTFKTIYFSDVVHLLGLCED